MSATVADVNPKTLENAKRQFVELYGSALVMNTYLKVALLIVSLIAIGLLGLNFWTAQKYQHLKPLVIRIDDIGRAQAVQYDSLTYRPQGQAPELKYFLTTFVTKRILPTTALALAIGVAWPAAAAGQDAVKRGEEVYAAQKCQVCHAIGGKG